MPDFEHRTEVQATAADAFRWHERPGAFVRLSPPWDRVEIVSQHGGIEDGGRLSLKIGAGPLTFPWVAVHQRYEEGRRFVDFQETGPFAQWVHEHEFSDTGPGRSVVIDRIDYLLPFGAAGRLAFESLTRARLTKMFRYRGAVLAGDIARHAPYKDRPPLRVAITGSSGMLGRQLAAFLTTGGHEVWRVVRNRKPAEGEIPWNIATGRIDHEALEGLDAIVHLSGANLATRWTPEHKAEIERSRVASTQLLAGAVAVLRQPPKVFLSASAVGYYGDRGAKRVDETSSAGTGFLSEVAKKWEAATEPAAAAGVRTVNLRFGIILSARGGALAKMLPAFKLCAGGPVGTGDQVFSWIGLDDAIYAIHHLIRTESVRGPVNVVAPGALPQREFARELGRVLGRPAVVPLPAFAVRALFGQMGEETLLSGQFVEPGVLRRSGFSWDLPLGEAFTR